MSTKKDKKAIGDSKYVVELHKDNFDLFMQFLNEPFESPENLEGHQLFSHGEVEYYNIHSHPKPFMGNRWREVFVKHSDFDYQNKYRAALFASDHFFEKVSKKPMVLERKIYTKNREVMEFNLKFSVQSGVDMDGWRYIELDISEFAANISPEPSKIITV